MNTARYAAIVAAALLPVALTACPHGNDDATTGAPAVSVAPVPTPTQTALVLAVEDAGSDAADAAADADAAKLGGPTNLQKCCNAIAQNQKSAPPDQQLLYAGFLAACRAGVVPPQFRSLAPCK